MRELQFIFFLNTIHFQNDDANIEQNIFFKQSSYRSAILGSSLWQKHLMR